MIGIQTCVSSTQALVMARAVELAGPEVFSVTASDGEWIVWFRFELETQAEAISGHFLRLWKEQQEFDRCVAEAVKPRTRPSPVNRKSKKSAS